MNHLNPDQSPTSADPLLQTNNLSSPSGISIGKTDELTLRVSGACLTLMLLRVGGEQMVLFERVMKLDERGDVKTQLQPIGGAAGILNCHALEVECGPYNFDSTAAAKESDLRIFISPSQWPRMREFLESEFVGLNADVIENTPLREIQEEIGQLIGVDIDPSSFQATRVGCHFQDRPRESARKDDAETVRVFAVDEVRISDSELTACILEY